ncbi:Glycine receptor subunit alpha-3 [Tyrophagus putrescentiae]|nr:Glycine receptor subunit alpha-3 [Tyrophagus putrescentiae]
MSANRPLTAHLHSALLGLFCITFFVFLLIESGYCNAGGGGGANLRAVEKKILDDIIGSDGRQTSYDRRIRPAGANQTSGKDGPANVTINLLVRSISSIDDVTMVASIAH